MVWPDMLVTMSPGLIALPPGMFSVAGMMPTTFNGRRMSAAALTAPSTLAAPHMSNFISSISPAGLMEMPPVSNVMPLPTSATGGASRLPPLYSRMMNLGGWWLPRATARKQPMPRRSMSFCSSTSTLMPLRLPSSCACSARYVGVQTFPGRLPRSFANAMPSAIAIARRIAESAFAASALSAACTAIFLRARFASGGLLFSRSKRYVPSMTAVTTCSAFHAKSRFFTGSSAREIVASAAPVERRTLTAAASAVR